MYIEDVTRPGINIAAEITTKDAYGFQEMCQIFAKKTICQKMCQKDDEDWNTYIFQIYSSIYFNLKKILMLISLIIANLSLEKLKLKST